LWGISGFITMKPARGFRFVGVMDREQGTGTGNAEASAHKNPLVKNTHIQIINTHVTIASIIEIDQYEVLLFLQSLCRIGAR
jgi:hypothetical protein